MSKSETDGPDSKSTTVSDASKIEQLTEIVRQRDAQLAHAYDSLARFSAAISHDIQSPINTLKQLLNILENEHGHRLDSDAQELIRLLQTSASRSKELADGIVKLSRKCKPTRKFSVVNSTELVHRVVDEHANHIKRQNVTIVVNKLPEFTGDSTAMHTVFYELVDNALKFNPTDNQARTITISCSETEEHIEFLFEDQGIGIAAQDTDKVFAPLTRLHNRDVYQGAGLGLSLCTVLVNSLRGRLWVSASETGSCIFHVRLPKLPAPA